MRVTVIPADRWIRRDDVAVNLLEWPFDDTNIHAIQWYGTEGEIEYAGPSPHNEIIVEPAVLEPYLKALDAHLAEAAVKTERSAPVSSNQTLEQILDVHL